MPQPADILVADDERVIREGCARILDKAGHRVATAFNGQEALELIRKNRYDLVLLDIKMPALDGLRVMDILRRENLDVLIVIITGYATVETAVEAMKAGAYDLLLIPFSPDSLRIVVNRALEHLRLNREMKELRKLQARSLRDIAAEQSRVRTIMNSMPCGVLVTDNEKNLVLFNPLGPWMLELDPAAMGGRLISEVLPQQELVEMIDRICRPGGAESTVLEREIKIGQNLFLRARAAPVRTPEGDLLGTVTVLQDVTQFKEIDRIKSEFMVVVSHDLKAPLATIRQQMDVLLEGLAGPVNPKQAHLLDRARHRVQGLLDLINQLLDLSRIEAGRVLSRQEPLDLTPILRRAVEFLAPRVETKNQQIMTQIPAFLPEVAADPRNMEEVFINVIENAIKFTPEGGRIDVSAERSGDYVRIKVADTGYGISKDDLPRIFDRFFRVKSDKPGTISGTGLGLTIVKGIVEAHLGRIKVNSQVGQGTVLTIELPVLKTGRPAPPAVSHEKNVN